MVLTFQVLFARKLGLAHNQDMYEAGCVINARDDMKGVGAALRICLARSGRHIRALAGRTVLASHVGCSRTVFLRLIAGSAAPLILSTQPACSTLLPSEWRAGVPGADPPSGETVGDWIAFAEAQAGQLEKSNDRYRAAVGSSNAARRAILRR